MSEGALAALTWDPQVKGGLYVLIALVVLPGAAYLLLTTNVGARLGFQLAAAGFFGWMVLMGIVWWIYGIGLVGPGPEWKPTATVTGELASARQEALRGYPRGWRKLDIEGPVVSDAQAVVDTVLVPPPEAGGEKVFSSSDDYLLVAAAEKGGKAYGPLGLNFRPFNVFHAPRHLVIQVQKVFRPPAAPGQPPPRAVPDPAQPPVAVVMERDLGSLRLYPGVITVSSMLIFGLLVYSLHRRDKEALARRAEARTT